MQNPTFHPRCRVFALLGLVGLCLAPGACSKKEAPESEPIVPVQLAEVRLTTVERTVTADGILYPITQSAVVPKISAPVREFHVNRGDHVRKGQLLAVLENNDLSAASAENQGLIKQAEAVYKNTTAASLPEELEKARLDVQAGKTELDAAERVLESRKELLHEGAIARRSVDESNLAFVQAKAQYELAVRHLEALEKVGSQTQVSNVEGQVEAARARHLEAEAQLQYSRITSPIDGVVADRPLYPGEMANPGAPLLLVMDVSRVVARANVPTGQLRFVRLGCAASVTSRNGTVHEGKVTVVSPAVDANSTTAEVWVTVDNPGGRLRPGETVGVSIVAEKIENATVVPAAAILPSREGAEIVIVVGSDLVAHERTVSIGVRTADVVQILEGVKLGEKVVTEGALGVEDKAKVRVAEANQAGKPNKAEKND
jgi:HlyD family secretion protein